MPLGPATNFYTFQVLKVLTTKWKDMPAFKLGIIDDKGNNLRKTVTLKMKDEQMAYTPLHKLIFNIKKIIEKIPFGSSKIGTYVAALALLREHTGEDISADFFEDYPMQNSINEWFEVPTGLSPGDYILTEEVYIPELDSYAVPGWKVKSTEEYSVMHGVNVYKVVHEMTGKKLLVTGKQLKHIGFERDIDEIANVTSGASVSSPIRKKKEKNSIHLR